LSFTNIKGQDSAISYLKVSMTHDTLSHAYIFLGPKGVGKFLAALNFAKVLNCYSPAKDEPCDACASCKKVDNFSHPDVFILRPIKKAGSIGIDEIRELIKNISLRPFEGRRKIYIIDAAETLKHEAANALLKTLEEPPRDSVLILITDNLKALFHTIVSRSQVVRFSPLKLKEIEDILRKEYSVDEVSAHVLSRLSSGSFSEALKFKDGDMLAARALLLNGVLNKSLNDMDFDTLTNDNTKVYLDILLTWFRDILNTKAGIGDSMLVNIDKKDIITSESKTLSFDYLEEIIDNIISTIMYIDQNANPKLAMSVLALKINEIRNTNDERRNASNAGHTCTK
jgi:DNA polymerase III subunit delta'